MDRDEWDDQEQIAEIEAELIDFTRGVTWRRVMKPAFERRQEDIARKLCRGSTVSLEDIRKLQYQFNLIASILDNPVQFFSRRTINE